MKLKLSVLLVVVCLVLPVGVFGQSADTTQFSPATLIAKAVEALSPDVPYLNDIEMRRYVTEIDNWKKNWVTSVIILPPSDAGHQYAIPDPPLKWELKVDVQNYNVAVVRSTVAVCAKYVPPPSKAAAIVPAFLPGRYLCVMGDNAPAGYRLTTADGVLVEKFIALSPFGPMPEYRKVN